MKAVIFGPGALGGYFGAVLAAAGLDVAFIARGETLKVMRQDGLFVDSADAGKLHIAPVTVSDDPSEIGPADVVILCMKTYDLDAAAATLSPLLHDKTGVITTQNGVEAADIIRPHMSRGHLLPGTLFGAVERPAPGRILQPGRPPRLTFGGEDSESASIATEIATAFADAGLNATAVDDPHAAIWSKFVFFVANSTVGCLLRLPCGAWRDEPGARALFVQAVEETGAVAAARGVAMGDQLVDRMLTSLDNLDPRQTSSTLRDLWAGRRIEAPFVIGAVSRLSADLGVATPFADMADVLLRPYADGAPEVEIHGS